VTPRLLLQHVDLVLQFAAASKIGFALVVESFERGENTGHSKLEFRDRA